MTTSRIWAILAALASALAVVAGLLDQLSPDWALIVAGIGVAITAFTERVQGGKGKAASDGRP